MANFSPKIESANCYRDLSKEDVPYRGFVEWLDNGNEGACESSLLDRLVFPLTLTDMTDIGVDVIWSHDSEVIDGSGGIKYGSYSDTCPDPYTCVAKLMTERDAKEGSTSGSMNCCAFVSSEDCSLAGT